MIDNAKDLLRELKNVSRQYENEKLYTFEVSRKRMADDCIKIVEQQEKQIAELEKEIKELKAENEKMKCCGNCKHGGKSEDGNFCRVNKPYWEDTSDNCNNLNKWELSE